MTLPNAGKPIIEDQVKSILDDIMENEDYLDSTLKKHKVVSFSINWATEGLGAVSKSVTGVGFKPSTVILFSSNAYYTCFSWGMYAPASGAFNKGMHQTYTDKVGINDFSIWHSYDSGPPAYLSYGGITSLDSDGFSILCLNSFTYSTSTFIALCIK